MLKKKSYMNKSNIIAEGFFSKLFKKIKDRKLQKKIKNDRKVNNHLNKLNQSTQNLEDLLNSYLKDAGLKPDAKLSKFTLKDFL